MAASLVDYLERFREREGRPLDFGVYYQGGTIFCIPDSNKELGPIKKIATIQEIVLDYMYYGRLVDAGLIDLDFIDLGAMDSSQMVFRHRDKVGSAVSKRHLKEDGGMIFHGTDSGADTASYIGLSMPYLNPVKLWNSKAHLPKKMTQEDLLQFRNVTNPYSTVSCQTPIPDRYRPINLGSDGIMSLELGIMLAASRQLGGSHYLLNFFQVENGFWSEKKSDSNFGPYERDRLVFDPEAMLTGFGLVLKENRLKPHGNSNDALFIKDGGKFEGLITVVNEGSHLETIKAVEVALEKGNTNITEYVHLPKIILYVSKGAGNVREEDYKLLKFARNKGAYILRVPLPGGRVPTINEFGEQQHFYAVPGRDIPSINLTAVVAKQKAALTLSLANSQKIPSGQLEKFVSFMMSIPWNGREFLPTNVYVN